MTYDLYATNPLLSSFRMAGSWPHLLAQCGAYFPFMTQGARWYVLHDERMVLHFHGGKDDENGETTERVPSIDGYPALLCNCGFAVTEEEAKVLARIARNYALIQGTLPKPTDEEWDRSFSLPVYLKPFPMYIRRDWIEQYEQFAVWAEQSQGFNIH